MEGEGRGGKGLLCGQWLSVKMIKKTNQFNSYPLGDLLGRSCS